MFAPAASATFASAQIRSTAGARPSAPSAAAHVVSIVHDLKIRLDASKLFQLLVEQDWVVDHELACMLRRLGEQIALGADTRAHTHDNCFANRIDRRICHLCEELLEVRIEKRLAAGEDGERRVVPHRADRLLRVARQRRKHRFHVLLRVAEEQLPAAQRLGWRLGRGRRRQIGEPQLFALDPVRVWTLRRNRVLRLLVGNDPPLFEIDEEEPAGLKPSLPHDVRGVLVEHAGLRSEHDPAVGGLMPAAGPQAVAVECRPDHTAVSKRDRSRPVPRFHEALVEGVEAV